MKVTSIGLYSSNDVEIATLSFRDPGSVNPYIAKSITGLDADEIVPRFYGLSKVSKEKYYNLSLPPRDVILTIILNPFKTAGKTYSDLRDAIYKALAASRTALMGLRFYNGATEVARVSGFVTKMESPQFEEQPTIQLTLNCDDPMLKAPSRVSVIESGAELRTVTVDTSTAPHGFIFQLTFTAAIASFYMQDKATNPEWSFVVTPTTSFAIGDKLYFSSENDNKYLYMVRGSTTTHLVDKIAPGGIWPILFPGDNEMVHSPEITWNMIQYYPTFWGV